MKKALVEHCWQLRTKPSPFIVSLIEEIIEHPERYAGTEVPPAGLDYSSVYLSDELWGAGIAAAEALGTRLSAAVRVGIARELAAANIPWTVSPARPRKEHIPEIE